MSRALHIIREVAAGIAHTCSATVNTLGYNGDMHTSLSARAYMERHDPEWERRKERINKLFPFQADHCKSAWEADLERAIKKVEANIK